MTPISIQLYTLRDAAAKDLAGVLKKVAAIGYKAVEFAGLYDHKPKEVRKVLDDLGLVASSAHIGVPTPESKGEIVDTAKALGYSLVITSRGPDDFKTLDGIKRTAEEFQKGADLVKAAGLRFGYHNHWWEMEKMDGRLGLERLLEAAPGMFWQADVYWAANFGKVDVPALVAAHKDRIPVLHAKDGPLVQGKPHTAVGKGKMDMPKVLKAADPKVLRWVVVELDECATDMVKAVEDSYTYLTSKGLAEGNR